jgi:hypothetical protein
MQRAFPVPAEIPLCVFFLQRPCPVPAEIPLFRINYSTTVQHDQDGRGRVVNNFRTDSPEVYHCDMVRTSKLASMGSVQATRNICEDESQSALVQSAMHRPVRELAMVVSEYESPCGSLNTSFADESNETLPLSKAAGPRRLPPLPAAWG